MASINILFSKLIPSNQGCGQKHYCNLSGIGSINSHQESRTPSFSLIKQRKIPHFSFNVIKKTTNAAVIPASSITIDKNLSSNGHLDSGHPSKLFSSIPEAIEDFRQGKFVIVVDDEDRENEGDLIMAASLVTPEASTFLVKYGTGIVCVCMKSDHLERLQLPLMVNDKENEEKLRTAFTITVDAKHGTTTGVSAQDRTATILALASRNSKAEDFIRPGHIFPLMYREGGVLKRPGHTEASVDLAVLAGLDPVAVICEIVADDGSMARLPQLIEFANEHNFKIISIAELISFIAPKQSSENV